MITKTIQLFKFAELKQCVQDRLIQDELESIEEYPFLEEEIEEELRVKLQENKIHYETKPILNYSLGYCKGDGVCFMGGFKWKNYFIAIRKIDSHYSHYKTVRFEIETAYGNPAKDEVYSEFKELYETICRHLEKIGYDNIEAERDPENIKQRLVDNDFDYDERGRIFNKKTECEYFETKRMD